MLESTAFASRAWYLFLASILLACSSEGLPSHKNRQGRQEEKHGETRRFLPSFFFLGVLGALGGSKFRILQSS